MSAKLAPTNAERAERELADVRRRYEALVVAVDTATNELLEVGERERDKLVEAARTARERAVARVEQAASEIENAIAEEQAALSVARWAQDPASRKWKVALASGEVGRPGIRIDRLIEGNRRSRRGWRTSRCPARSSQSRKSASAGADSAGGAAAGLRTTGVLSDRISRAAPMPSMPVGRFRRFFRDEALRLRA
jgi:hypothetical protein